MLRFRLHAFLKIPQNACNYRVYTGYFQPPAKGEIEAELRWEQFLADAAYLRQQRMKRTISRCFSIRLWLEVALLGPFYSSLFIVFNGIQAACGGGEAKSDLKKKLLFEDRLNTLHATSLHMIMGLYSALYDGATC